MEERTTQVLSFEYVDVSDIKLLMVAVYEKPDDYPKDFVARIFDGGKPTNTVVIEKDLGEIRRKIHSTFPYLIQFNRGAEDVKSLVECWL